MSTSVRQVIDFHKYTTLFLFLFSESNEDPQHALSQFEEYCHTWKLTVNILKTKVIVFSNRKPQTNMRFHFENEELEIVNYYK